MVPESEKKIIDTTALIRIKDPLTWPAAKTHSIMIVENLCIATFMTESYLAIRGSDLTSRCVRSEDKKLLVHPHHRNR